jgi:hypothetical protein
MRSEQPLSIKLENIMGRFIKTIYHPEFKWLKEKFPIPIKNPETGLLKYDLTNPFYEKIWPKTSKIFFYFTYFLIFFKFFILFFLLFLFLERKN